MGGWSGGGLLLEQDLLAGEPFELGDELALAADGGDLVVPVWAEVGEVGIGHLAPLGADTGSDNLTFTVTGASTFSYTGTRTFVAANGDKVFSAVTGTGTLTRTAAHSTETDTITGGTGRFAGATGTYQDTISSVVISSAAGWQTSRVTATAHGQIRY
jgi:hypothetical protein